jgi:hypothetical protein
LEELPDQLNAAARLRIHPDDLSILDESDKIMMETGMTFKLQKGYFQTNRIKSQIREIGNPIRMKREIIGMQGTIQDVTKGSGATTINNKLLDESQSIAKIGS